MKLKASVTIKLSDHEALAVMKALEIPTNDRSSQVSKLQLRRRNQSSPN